MQHRRFYQFPIRLPCFLLLLRGCGQNSVRLQHSSVDGEVQSMLAAVTALQLGAMIGTSESSVPWRLAHSLYVAEMKLKTVAISPLKLTA